MLESRPALFQHALMPVGIILMHFKSSAKTLFPNEVTITGTRIGISTSLVGIHPKQAPILSLNALVYFIFKYNKNI